MFWRRVNLTTTPSRVRSPVRSNSNKFRNAKRKTQNTSTMTTKSYKWIRVTERVSNKHYERRKRYDYQSVKELEPGDVGKIIYEEIEFEGVGNVSVPMWLEVVKGKSGRVTFPLRSFPDHGKWTEEYTPSDWEWFKIEHSNSSSVFFLKKLVESGRVTRAELEEIDRDAQ